jgi:amyloid beta precursor protein binding protein 1
LNICSLGIYVDEHGNPEAEENFEEAIRAVTSSIRTTVVPSHVKDILEDDSCVNVTSKVKVLLTQMWS